MGFRSAVIDRLYVVRLDGDVNRDDVDRIVREAASAAREAGGKVVYLGIHAATLETPREEVRAHIGMRANELLEHASTLELVLEGDGIKASLLRTVMRGMITVARLRRSGPSRAFMHATVRNALDRVAGQLSMPVSAIEGRIVEAGLASRR